MASGRWGLWGVPGRLAALLLTAAPACSGQDDPPPIVSQVLVSPEAVAPGGRIRVALSAHDPAGSALSYHWTPPDGWTVVSSEGPALTLEAPERLGEEGLVIVQVQNSRAGVTSETAVVRTVQQAALALQQVMADPNPAPPGGTITVTAVAAGGDPSSVSYGYALDGDGWSMISDGGSATVVAPLAYGRTAALTVTATAGGIPATTRVILATVGAQAPQVAPLIATTTTPAPGGTVDLAAVAASPAGLPLACAWTVSDPSWTIAATGARASVTAPVRSGAAAIVTFTARDTAGASTSADVVLTATAGSAPVVAVAASPSTAVTPGGTVALVATAPGGTATPPVTWSVSDPAWALTASGASATVRAPLAYGEVAIVTVAAGVAPGATASAVVSTVAPSPPVLSELAVGPNPVDPGGTAWLSVVGTSPAGLPLSFAWTTASPTWSLTAAGPSASVTAPAQYGDATLIRVTATDGAGSATSAVVALSTVPAPAAVAAGAAAAGPAR